MAKTEREPLAVRQFLADAERAEARARSVGPGLAAEWMERAASLRAAAARIAAEQRRRRGDELPLDG